MAKHFFKILADTQSDNEVEIERTIVIIKTKKEVVFYFAPRVCLGSRERTLRPRGVAREQITQLRTVFNNFNQFGKPVDQTPLSVFP